MPAYKNKDSGSWYVVTQYTDWTGERKQKCKRGFGTRREAPEWEEKFKQQSSGNLNMSFEAFVEIYTNDLKESTWQTKNNIIQNKIVPYFGNRKINEIVTKDVIAWQNELLAYRDEKHKPYSPTYLERFIINYLLFLTTQYDFMTCAPTQLRKPEIWGVRKVRKCCSGRKRSIRNLPR